MSGLLLLQRLLIVRRNNGVPLSRDCMTGMSVGYIQFLKALTLHPPCKLLVNHMRACALCRLKLVDLTTKNGSPGNFTLSLGTYVTCRRVVRSLEDRRSFSSFRRVWSISGERAAPVVSGFLWAAVPLPLARMEVADARPSGGIRRFSELAGCVGISLRFLHLPLRTSADRVELGLWYLFSIRFRAG